MKHIIYFFLIGCILIYSCSIENKGKNIQQINRDDNLIIIDIDTVKKDGILFSSLLFDGFTPIILETNNESLIGEICKIEVHGDFIVILDNVIAKNVFLFDINGNFIRKIGNRGQGPGEYTAPSDFTVDLDNKYIYIYDSNSRKIDCFNIQDGTFIRSVKIDNRAARIYYIQYYNNKLYADASCYENDENQYMLQEIDLTTGKQTARWLNNKKYNKGYSNYAGDNMFLYSSSPFYNNSDFGPKFVDLCMDTILSFDKNGISPYLTINSKDFINEHHIKSKKDKEYKEVNNFRDMNVIYDISNYIELPEVILFEYQYNFSKPIVLYNKNSKSTKIYQGIMDDLVFKIDLEKHDYGMSSKFAWSDKKGVYSFISSFQMERLLSFVHADKLNLSETQKEKFIKLSEDDNPVIFLYHPKK